MVVVRVVRLVVGVVVVDSPLVVVAVRLNSTLMVVAREMVSRFGRCSAHHGDGEGSGKRSRDKRTESSQVWLSTDSIEGRHRHFLQNEQRQSLCPRRL